MVSIRIAVEGCRVPRHHEMSLNVPSMTSHSGFWTRSSSDCGSRRDWTLTLFASAISLSVRWRMKTGLPRHLMMTWFPPIVSMVGRRIWWQDPTMRRTHILALRDGRKIDLDLGHGQNVGRGAHVDEELCHGDVSPRHQGTGTQSFVSSCPASSPHGIPPVAP